MKRIGAVLLGLALGCSDPRHQPGARFVEQAGALPDDAAMRHPSAGVVVLDYDGDGFDDLFIPTGAFTYLPPGRFPLVGNALLHNNRDGTFSDVAAAAGVDMLAARSESRPRAAFGGAAADVDNDGAIDLFVTVLETWRDGIESRDGYSVLFHNNGDGTFRDVSAAAGLDDAGSSISAAFGDIDNDGFVDLYVADLPDYDLYNGGGGFGSQKGHTRNRLYHNNRDGTFTEIGEAAGVALAAISYQPTFVDVDGDGRLDLVVAVENDRLHIFHNDGGLRFSELDLGPALSGQWLEGMGLAVSDVDDDGRLDLFVTNVGVSAYFGPWTFWPVLYPERRAGAHTSHLLLHNDGAGAFSDIAGKIDVASDYAPRPRDPLGALPMPAALPGLQRFEFGWGALFADYDNDGVEDLFWVGCDDIIGGVGPVGSAERGANPGRLLRRLGPSRFADVGAAAGLQDVEPDGTIDNSAGVAFTDVDHDGFVDFVVVNALGPSLPAGVRLFRNQGNGNHFVAVRLRGDGVRDNRSGIGAIVRLVTGGKTQQRLVSAGSSFASQNTLVAHFGLGRATRADAVEVQWPSGVVQRVAAPPIDRLLVIDEQN